jgi:DNA-binding response OmpR family regulator
VTTLRKSENRDIVLVVDDSPETLSLLTDAIEQAGMTVLVAREGEQALSIVEKVLPDIILMDALMPGTDGFETCRRLKRKKTLAYVPIIFMTGLSETQDIVKGLEAGGVDYVTKPIVPDELLARIRVHLANARLAHSARAALDASGRYLLATDSASRSAISEEKATCCCQMYENGCKSVRTPTSNQEIRFPSNPTAARSNCSFHTWARSAPRKSCFVCSKASSRTTIWCSSASCN